ncbi:MAG: response regulator [Calditrichaeota bacterium]|nr:response regulator [Calditrichota bacterium]
MPELYSKRILVVDDDETIRQSLSNLILAFGFVVESAVDGYEALAKLHLDIDLVLLDVDLPGLDGYDVAERIRDTTDFKDLPVVMVTGVITREGRLRAFEVGANDFITKPVDTIELKLRLSSLLKMKSAQDEIKQSRDGLERMVEKRSAALRLALDSMAAAQRKLRESEIDTIHRLAIIAEYKDPTTAAHLKRISRLCENIGKALNLPPSDLERLRYASPMHDVGKIGVDPNILLKPGRLNDEEWEIMRRHPAIGGNILTNSTSDLLQTGEKIALTHHEKWNGSGYPSGLAGDDIPLLGRICAVADVFDALVSQRCYKAAVSIEEAFRQLDKDKGEHFDPLLVDVLTSLNNIVDKAGDK